MFAARRKGWAERERVLLVCIFLFFLVALRWFTTNCNDWNFSWSYHRWYIFLFIIIVVVVVVVIVCVIFMERGFFFENRVQKLENSLKKNGIFFNDRAIFDESKDEWFMYMCIMARIIENCAIDGAKYQIDIRMNVKMKNLYTYMYNTRIVGKLCNRHFTVK